MPHERVRARRWIGIAVVLFAAIAALVWLRREQGMPPASAPVTEDTRDVAAGQRMEFPARSAGESGAVAPSSGEEDTPSADLEPDQDMIALRWAQVDLDALRSAMPDNLYWKLGAPTSDPTVQRERAEERARWNEVYGKVLSGTASEEEIHAYYDQRARLSSDYVEFASRVLQDYGKVLPARDIGLLELSLKMHHARLQQMPRRLTEALERKEHQDRLREAWLADEKAFEQAQADEAQRARR